ncbi:MAG: bifunctional isocitrate dehydrogenase kinase/phosphatase [Gammaproteobacteria bacterium]
MDTEQAQAIARTILDGFERHYRLFQEITAGAMRRFEAADWRRVQRVSRERIHYYDQRVDETLERMRGCYGIRDPDEALWRRIKVEYVHLLHQHRQPELAETYFNSVFCHLFHRRYYNTRHIFVRPAISTEHLELEVPTWTSHYPAREGFHRTLARMLDSCGFTLPFEDRRRDLRNLLRAVRERIPDNATRQQNFQVAVLDCLFFRNKAGYIIGKAVNGADETPFAIPILNNEHGGLYVDTLLVGEAELANLFSFARSYFMVDTPVPSVVVEFLSRVLPCKTKADLYTAIGLQKHGKTEFYRDFLRHLGHSSDEFVIAPGVRGLVMTVFTLPSYPYVFKVIKDRFPPPKDTTRQAVMAKYRLVKEHDRVGRMADSLEYSDAAFPLARFSAELRQELTCEAASSIDIDGDQLVIKHLYIERRMTPLNVFLDRAAGEALRSAIDEYGKAIRELAAANIFPGDMLLKNFGVTRQGRVVFYDYDDICYLTECRFRRIPEPPYPEFELAAEPWYSVAAGDVFPEEFGTFLVSNPHLRKTFLALHADLLEPNWWQARQAGVASGRFEDVFPYSESLRFTTSPRQHTPRITARAQEIATAACG